MDDWLGTAATSSSAPSPRCRASDGSSAVVDAAVPAAPTAPPADPASALPPARGVSVLLEIPAPRVSLAVSATHVPSRHRHAASQAYHGSAQRFVGTVFVKMCH
jgi:hypothetical protein